MTTADHRTSLPPVASIEDASSALAKIGLRSKKPMVLAEKQGLINTVYLAETDEEGLIAIKANRSEESEKVFQKEFGA